MYRRGMYIKVSPPPFSPAIDKFHRGQRNIKFRTRLHPICGEVAAPHVCVEKEKITGFSLKTDRENRGKSEAIRGGVFEIV